MIQMPPLFRFTHDFVSQGLNPNQLTLALQLGWLQPVGWSPTTGDKVYSFYHATFQEYFAAQGITDGQQFVEYQTQTETLQPIFSAQWQEVVLLWLGRSDVPVADKTGLLQALVDFADGCGGFYETQAKLLATKGLAEFPQFSGGQGLLQQVVNWRFQQQKDKPTVWIDPAGEALAHSDRSAVIAVIEKFVKKSKNPFERWLAAHSLGKNYDFGNEVAIATLAHLLTQISALDLQIEIAKSLVDIQPGHSLALQTLHEILQTASAPATRRKAAHRLGTIDPGNAVALQTLKQLLDQADPIVQHQALKSLQQIAPDHSRRPVSKKVQKPPLAAKSARRRQKTPPPPPPPRWMSNN